MSVDYAYFSSSFALVVVFLVSVVLFPSQRRTMLLCAFGSVPTALLSVSFVPVYWAPDRVAEFLVGPEDIAFSFATGGLMWLFAVWPLRRQVRLRWRPRTFVQRYLTLGPLFVLLFYFGRRTGLGPMPAALAGMALLALVVVFRKPNLGRLVIFGSAGFGLFYTIVLVVCFALWPQLATQWNAANLSGLLVWIIPGEEIAWAFTAGGAFPLVMAYALDADLASRSVHSDRSQSRLYLAEPPPASDG